MAAFGTSLTNIVSNTARLMSAQLKRQSPVDTGALKKSIKVTGKITNDSVIFTSNYLPYGVYTDFGTGPYNTYPKRGSWNVKPGKGTGGIKPRYWTSLILAVRTQVKNILAKALAKEIRLVLLRRKL